MFSKKIPFKWERLSGFTNENGNGGGSWRAKVYGGWILNSTFMVNDARTETSVFIPDPSHEWEI